jgi:hypothetical protein
MQRAAWRNENKKNEDGGRKQERTLGLVAACTHFESACESDSGPASDVERTKAIAKHSQILTPTLLFAHLVSTFFSTGRCQQSSAGRAGSSPAGKRPESWLPKCHVSEFMVWPARPPYLLGPLNSAQRSGPRPPYFQVIRISFGIIFPVARNIVINHERSLYIDCRCNRRYFDVILNNFSCGCICRSPP